MAAEPVARPSAGGPPSGPPARTARYPWREITFAVSVIALGPPVAILAFAFPCAAFTAILDRRPRRIAAGLFAVVLPALVAIQLPQTRFFVVMAVLAVAGVFLALGTHERVGYAEAALATFAALAASTALWLTVDPGCLASGRAAIESVTLRVGRGWVDWMARSGDLDAASRALAEEVAASTARWYARLWPTAAFLVLWLGLGASLELAARWGRGESRARERVALNEPFAAFRLSEAWVWILIASMAAFLLLPRGTVAAEAALNAALIATGLYACQGFSVVVYYLERRGIGPLRRTLGLTAAFLLLPIPLLVIALCLGLADVWVDARRGPAPDVPAEPGG